MNIFDDDWLAAAAEALGALDELPGASAIIDYVIAGAPDGKVTVGVTLADGRVAAMAIGKSKDPDLVISLKYDDALAILTGELSSDAGFMSGALKVEGAYERWLLEFRPIRVAVADALAPVMADTAT
ncbi:MAG: SCP2 sterol-binding domain-containing protein [Actinomycetota bacterium]